MATEESKKTASDPAKAPAAPNVGVRLIPQGDSDLPVLSNFARVQLSPSGVLVDFGFLEPAGLAALARTARAGGKMPEAVGGRLAGRYLLTAESLVSLHQQLGQAIAGLRSARKGRTEAEAKK